jgi:hypothetical protein
LNCYSRLAVKNKKGKLKMNEPPLFPSLEIPAEGKDFTPEEISEAEKIYQASMSRYFKEVSEDTTGMLARMFWSSAFNQVKKEKNEQILAKERHAQLAKLPLFPYPEVTRIVSNDMARSALFSAVQGGKRRILKKEVLATIEGIEIIFTGEELNQDDHDLLMQLVHFARHKAFGEPVTVPANAILAGLGCDKGGKDHKELRTRIERLLSPLLALKNTKTRVTYYGHIIESAVQDEKNKYWVYKLNPDLRPLYDTASFSLIEWEQRRALKRKDLARWLQAFYATHAEPFPLSVEYLHRMSGSQATLKEFRRALRNALEVLKTIGFLLAWEHDSERDIVAVHRAPTPKAIR